MTSINHIYKNMRPEQLAVIAVNAELAGDYELPLILLEYVPKKNYKATDASYTDLAQFLEGMVKALSADFWRAQAMHLYALLELSRWSRKEGSLDLEMSDEAFRKNQARLDYLLELANQWRMTGDMLSHVCSIICEESGLDEALVRKHIGMDQVMKKFDLNDLPDEVRSLMKSIIENWRHGRLKVSA